MNSDDVMVDKWDALKSLTDAATTFDVTHRTLSVLKALMTFLPQRLIAPAPRSAIVFPSNKTLSDRLNGMPDSTLRRHLAKLVSVGIVSRHDSANRKRFARHNGQGGRIAFGFDLSPLALHITHLRRAAERAARAHEALMAQRAEVAQLRQVMIDTPLAEEARQLLRRKPEAGALREMITRLDQAVTAKMNTSAAQNERHIHNEFINTYDSEVGISDVTKKTNADGEDVATVPLSQVLVICKEYKTYFPEPVRQWTDLIGIADRLTAMMGIDGHVFKDAIAGMGGRRAAIVVLCILERFSQIRNPGGYLRTLTQTARAGRFCEHHLLETITQSRGLSADNC